MTSPRRAPTAAVSGLRGSATVTWGPTFLVLGLVVFWTELTFAHSFPSGVGLVIRVGLVVALLVRWRLVHTRFDAPRLATTLYLFFTAATALLVATEFGDWAIQLLDLGTRDHVWIAVAKFSESVPIVLLVLSLPLAVGLRPRDLYVRTGALRAGLAIGTAVFLGFVVLAVLTGDATVLFADELQASGISELVALAPWVLLFALSNGFMEELLFRGLFLEQFESILGFRSANVVTAVVFSAAHVQVGYVTTTVVFLVVLFLLGLLLGAVMKRTDSIIAPALIHAGADVVMILPLMSTYV